MGDFDKLKQPGRRMFRKPHHLRSSCRTGDTLPREERTEGGVTSGISSRESCLGGQGFLLLLKVELHPFSASKRKACFSEHVA